MHITRILFCRGYLYGFLIIVHVEDIGYVARRANRVHVPKKEKN